MRFFFIGFGAFFKGVKFSISKLGIWYIVPIFLWLILFVVLSLELSEWAISILYETIESLTGISMSSEASDSDWLEILKTGIHWGFILVIKLFVWYILGRYMKYLILILLAPLFAYLSEKTEELVAGKIYPFSLIQFIKDILRGVGITFRNMFIESFIILVASIIGFIFPIISPILLILLFFLNSYFMAFNFFDYVVERKRMNIGKSVRYMRANAMTLIGFGTAYNIVSWIPLLDWVLAPISATAGAVLADRDLPEGKNSTSFI
jgi:CysZ protein